MGANWKLIVKKLLKYLVLGGILGVGQSAVLGVGLVISPAVITNDFNGKITLNITGLASGKKVLVEKFADANANGVIEAIEPLFGSWTVSDGQAPAIGGVRNLNVPGDEDGAANGQIRMEFIQPGVLEAFDVIAGTFVFRVSDPASGFTPVTATLGVKQKVMPQGVSGRITVAGSGAPLTNTLVLLVPFDGRPITGMFADANGNYTLHGPPGYFLVLPLRPGYLADASVGVTIPVGQFVTNNATAAAATRTIAGQVKDLDTGTGLAGVFVMAEAEPAWMGANFTDATGNYVLGVSAANWRVRPERAQLAQIGYLGLDEYSYTSTLSGNVTGLDFPMPKATALIYGTLRDRQNRALADLSVSADDNYYQADGRGVATNFYLGVTAGDWRVSQDDTELASQGYFERTTNVTLAAGQAVRVDLVLASVTAHVRGRLVDSTGAPVAMVGLGANHGQDNASSRTDASGGFDLGVYGGQWNFWLDSDDARRLGLVGLTPVGVIVSDGIDHNGLVLTVSRATTHVRGRVVDNLGQPVPNITVTAFNEANTYVWADTDAAGAFDLQVFGGQWTPLLWSEVEQQAGVVTPEMPAVLVVDGVDQTNMLWTVQRTTAAISGWVRDPMGNPLGNAVVWANATLNGQHYSRYVKTDGNGNYQLQVFNAEWEVRVDNMQIANQFVLVAGQPATANFAQGGGWDGTPPELAYSDPSDGATLVPVETTLSFTFSEPMQNQSAIRFNDSLPRYGTSWSGDARTLTVRFETPLPPGKTVVWTLEAWSFYDVAGNALAQDVSGQFTTAPSNPPGPDALFFAVVKAQQDYLQSDATSAPVLSDSSPYRFSVSVGLAAPGTVESAFVRLPGGTLLALQPDGDTSLSFKTNFSSQATFDAAFPAGIYSLILNAANDGVFVPTLSLTGNAYPDIPRVSNLNAAQAIDPDADFVLAWDPMSGGATNDYIQVQVRNARGDTLFSSGQPGQPGALNGTHTSVVIPRHSLPPGQTNQCRVMFAKVVARNTTAYPGVLGLAGYYRRTTANLVTLGVPEGFGPGLVSSSPVRGQRDVATNAVIAFTFDKPMQARTSIQWNGVDGYKFTQVWTSDRQTLLCTYQEPLPANAGMGWTLNPSGSGFRDLAGNDLGTYSGGFATGNSGVSPDVRFYVVGKYQQFVQTSPSAPQPGDRPFFFARVFPNLAYGVSEATVTLPGGGVRALEYSDSSLGYTESFSSLSELDAAYPAGSYTISLNTAHDGAHAGTLNLGANAFPAAPRVSNYTAAQAVNPMSDFTVTWDGFAGGTHNDYIQLRVRDVFTDEEVLATPEALQAGALTGQSLSVTIPAGTLEPNRDYEGSLRFAKITATNSAGYAGAPGFAVFNSETVFGLHTVSAPLGLLVTPAAVPADYNGLVTLTVSGLSNGQPVLVEKFLDLNRNAAVDAADLMVQSYRLADGEVTSIGGARNLSVPADDDGFVNGQIRSRFQFKAPSEINQGAASYLYRVAPVGSGFAPLTAAFTVTQAAYSQKITGRVTSGGNPVPYPFVFLVRGVNSSPLLSVVGDTNGYYTLNCPTGRLGVATLKSGQLFNINEPSNVTVSAGATVTQNLSMLAADRTIAGQLADADSGTGLVGVQLFAQADNGLGTLAVSDSGGRFGIPVLSSAGMWSIDGSSKDGAWLNYVAADSGPPLDASAGNVSGVAIRWPKATSLIHGSVMDSLGQPLAGAPVRAENDGYSCVGRTDLEGNFALGVTDGPWRIATENDDLAMLGYLGNALQLSVAPGRVEWAYLTVWRAQTHVRGRAIDNTGAALAHCELSADNGQGIRTYVQTDAQGNFEFGLFGGAWHIEIASGAANQLGLLGPSLQVILQEGVGQENLLFTALRASHHLVVLVQDASGTPQAGLGISGTASLGNTEYRAWNRTDESGGCTLPVVSAGWNVGVSQDDLAARGFGPVPEQWVDITGADASITFVVHLAGVLPIYPETLPHGIVGQYYYVQFTTDNGLPWYQWRLASGPESLPPNLQLSADGILSGIPTASGDFYLEVSVTNNAEAGGSSCLVLTIDPAMAITTSRLPGRQVGLPYTNVTLWASGGAPPYAWAVTSGALPDGLALDALTGNIGGTPTRVGQFDFEVRVSDTTSNRATRALSIAIYPVPPGVPLANGMIEETLTGIATDGANFLVGIQTYPTPKPILFQRLTATGTLLGAPIILSQAGGRALAAYDGAHYLVVWEDATNDLYGQFLSPSGAVLGTPFAVSTAPGKQSLDSMRALQFDGTNCLVAWSDARLSGDVDGYGQLISPAGNLVGGEIPITRQSGDARSVSIVWGKTNYLATWMNQRGPGVELYDVWGRFVSRSGTLGGTFQISEVASPRAYNVRAAWNGTNFLVIWNQDRSGGPPNQGLWDVYGRLVAGEAGFAGNQFPIATNPAANHALATVCRAGGGFLVSWFENSADTAGSRAQLVTGQGTLTGGEINLGEVQGPRAPYAVVVPETTGWLVFSWWFTWGVSASGTINMSNLDLFSQYRATLAPEVKLTPLAWTWQANGAFGFEIGLTGTEGQPVMLQMSTNLIDWTDAGTFTSSTITLVEPAPGVPARFFRTVIK
jgi:hypothetical protein